MKPRILLVGGTGFIGRHLHESLDRTGRYDIKVLSRGRQGPEYVNGDLLDYNSLLPTLEGVDIVIQAAQFPGHPVERPWLGERYTYLGFDARGTRNLVRALERYGRHRRLQRYVYFSGAGVDHDHLSYPWLRAKREAEQAITDSGVPYTILRPSWVYGRGDSSMSKFVNMGRYLPAFPLLGDGSAPVNPIWIGDIAELVPVLLESEEAIGDKLTLGCPEQMTMRQVARTVLEELGMPRKPLVPQPKPLLKLAGAGAQFLPSSPLSPGSVDFLTMDVRLGQLPRDVYGIEIKPLREGLRASELLPTA